jgi:hypothetical protein
MARIMEDGEETGRRTLLTAPGTYLHPFTPIIFKSQNETTEKLLNYQKYNQIALKKHTSK